MNNLIEEKDLRFATNSKIEVGLVIGDYMVNGIVSPILFHSLHKNNKGYYDHLIRHGKQKFGDSYGLTPMIYILLKRPTKIMTMEEWKEAKPHYSEQTLKETYEELEEHSEMFLPDFVVLEDIEKLEQEMENEGENNKRGNGPHKEEG